MTKLQHLADYTDKRIIAGIDVHKKSWNVTLYYENRFLRTFSQPPAVDALTSLLRHDYPGAHYLCGYESGFSGFWIQRQFQQKGIECYVVHAADIPSTQKHKTIKTDTIDSHSLAQALSAGTVHSVYIPDPETESHRSLIRYRKRILCDMRRCKNRIRSFLFHFGYIVPDQFGTNWSNRFIKWLKDFELNQSMSRTTLNHMIVQLELLRSRLLEINRDIRQLQQSERYNSLLKNLVSVPGIGPLTAITLITEIVDMKRFSSFRQLNSFVGLYPMEYSSGEHVYKGNITIRSNHYLRDSLVEASWVSIRHDPALMLVYQDWKCRMTAKRAIVKIARKILSRIRYVWMNETPYVKGLLK